MKGFLILSIFLFFSLAFIISFSSAAINCADNQIIMRLSGDTNAHGSASDASYPSVICYSTLFGKIYGGANPQVCTAQNKNLVVALSGATNAHAATTINGPYTTPICYGDLSCVVKQGACLNTETEVLSLAGTTNSHLENATKDSPFYTTRICCVSPFVGGAVCGDNKIGANEQCDFDNNGDKNLNGQTCQSLGLGFTGGSLSCFSKGSPNQCTFDKSGCTGIGGVDVCGNGEKTGSEECDDGDLDNNDGCSSTCKIEQRSCAFYNSTYFTTPESACNADKDGNKWYKQDSAYGPSCSNPNVKCECAWSTAEEPDKCVFRKTSPPTDDQGGGACTNSCDSTSVNGACIDSYLTVKINSVYSGSCTPADPACKSQERTLLCGSPTIKLDFFGNVQIIITIIALAFVYAIIIIKKKK